MVYTHSMNYAQVVLCQKSGGFNTWLTYVIPSDLKVNPLVGFFVQVPLRKRLVRAIVVKITDQKPKSNFEIKPIKKVFTEVYLPQTHVKLAFEMATYYHCSLTKALRMIVPKSIWEGKFSSPKQTFYHLLKPNETLRGKKQQAVVEVLKQSGGMENKNQLIKKIGGVSAATLKGLISKKVLKLSEKLVYTPSQANEIIQKHSEHELTPHQIEALKRIQNSNKPVLLHGVTGSGKTELYLRAILKSIRQGKPALLMVPEIALTPQTIDYFKAYLGEHLAVFHSRLSKGEKTLNWYRVLMGHARLVIGSRSAVFAPARQWGVVIMDEEHEWTYKQESTPYYQTHFIVEKWQQWMGAKVILGTATPRLESFYKTKVGDYTYAHLPNRIGQHPLPEIKIIDLREEFKARHFSIFSRDLLRAMDKTLKKGEQVMLFVNQRGAARAVVCRDCGEAQMCQNCEVRLTFHRSARQEQLVCHYCGQVYCVPEKCPHCQSIHIKHIGVGTQRVEEVCHSYFPEAKVIRADQDTTRFKEGFLPMYHAFKNKEAHILVGTQMIAKGLHFEGVALIGIILADIGLNLPDFRAHERAFQLVTQVSGRSGRGAVPGQVILQTYQPNHFVFQQAQQMDYPPFAQHELQLRQKHGYPPFKRLIKFIVVGPHLGQLNEHLTLEKKHLEKVIELQHLNLNISLAPALIPRMNNQYYFHFLLRGKNPHAIFNYWQVPIGWRVDVDPVRVG